MDRIRRLAGICAWGSALFVATVARGQGPTEPTLVKDIEPSVEPGLASDVKGIARVGEYVFFSARDPLTGAELWRNDGSRFAGALVKDVVDGPGSSDPRQITDIGGIAYFAVEDELWKSDGTDGGTVLLKALDAVDELTAVDGTLYFAADDGVNGMELWRSDGTAEGTQMVADVNEGAAGSFPREMVALDGVVYFSAEHPNFGRELWRTDGTAGGTWVAFDFAFAEESGNPKDLTLYAGKLYLSANGFSMGEELWMTDGSQTSLVLELNPGPESSSPEQITALGDVLYFSASTPDLGREPWIVDVRFSGATLLRDINPGPESSNPRSFTNIEWDVFFSAEDASTGRELWRTDGSEPGTFLIRDFVPGPESSSPEELSALGSILFFTAIREGTTARELWRCHHPDFETRFVGTTFTLDPDVRELTPVGDTLFFRVSTDLGNELWSVDESEFVVRADLPGLVPASSFPSRLIAVGEDVLFRAFESTTGVELWRSDGTEAGTTLVKDIAPGPGSSLPGVIWGFVPLRDQVLFGAEDPVHGFELWRSDGTEAGTVLVKDIHPDGSSGPGELARLGDVVLFPASDGVRGAELWRTDGTADGTFLVKDIFPGPAGSLINQITVVGSTAFFVANTPVAGRELWKSDGTEAGTVLLKDIQPGQNDFGPVGLRAVSGLLYFVASDGVHGSELWKTDGTESGTVMAIDILPGPASSAPVILTSLGGALILVVNDNVHGHELWRTDGTAAGTVLIKDIVPGIFSSNPFLLGEIGDRLYFRADDRVVGAELWVTDGTEAGTHLLADIAPGPESSGPNLGTRMRDLLVFSAFTPELGDEMWQTDGTADGTVLVSDIFPGPGSSGPGEYTVAGRKLFLVAEDLLTGRELWVAALPNQPPVADAGADQTVEEGVAVTLDGSGSFDSDGDALTYSWLDGNGTVIGTTAVVSREALLPGDYVFTLNVDDGTDASADDILVTVLGPPTLSILDTSVIEGDSGTETATFQVALSRASTKPVQAFFVTLPGTAFPLLDFVPRLGLLELAPGVTEAEITVDVVGDRRCELDEHFITVLFLPTNAELADFLGRGTIFNDDCGGQ